MKNIAQYLPRDNAGPIIEITSIGQCGQGSDRIVSGKLGQAFLKLIQLACSPAVIYSKEAKRVVWNASAIPKEQYPQIQNDIPKSKFFYVYWFVLGHTQLCVGLIPGSTLKDHTGEAWGTISDTGDRNPSHLHAR